MLPNYGLARAGTGRLGAPPLALDRRAASAHDRTRTGSWHQWDHLFGALTYGGQPVFGYQSTTRTASRSTRSAANLRRHVRLDVRLRLEAREQLPAAHRHRRLLLLLPFNPRPRLRAPAGSTAACAPRGTARSTGATVMGRASRPDIAWIRATACRDYDREPGPGRRSSSRRTRSTDELAGDDAALPAELASPLTRPSWTNAGHEQRALFRRWPAGVSVVVADVDGRRPG